MKKLNPFIQELFTRHRSVNEFLPDILDTQRFTGNLIQLLFPNDRCDNVDQYRLKFKESRLLLERLMISLENRLDGKPDEQTLLFFDSLPEVYSSLVRDAEAIYNFDPAVTNLQEVICAYPGFYAIAVYRIANQLFRQGIPLLPRIMAEYAHGKTGIDIHPGATIGKSFFIDHGTGVVIGETTVIGNNVKIYQGVTLGALIVKKSMASRKRHPTIQDNVIIYAGSTVLGGETVIGSDSVIGGNVWLTESVPPNSMVYHTSTIKIRNTREKDEYLDFSI
ncbi:MAG: serine O-acetyltransferase EpsC [Bacteroidales bacterium]